MPKWAVRPERPFEGRLGSSRRASRSVSRLALRIGGSPASSIATSRKRASKGRLWATITASPRKAAKRGRTSATDGCSKTIAVEMPVSHVMRLGTARPGSMSCWNVSTTCPPTMRTAPISIRRSSPARAPVVSVSTITNGVSSSVTRAGMEVAEGPQSLTTGR